MKNLLIILFIIPIMSFGQDVTSTLYKGIRLDHRENETFIVNKNNVTIEKLDPKTFKPAVVIKAIRASNIKDKELIARILDMLPEKKKYPEMMQMSKSYTAVSNILMKHVHQQLEERLGKKGLKKAKKKK